VLRKCKDILHADDNYDAIEAKGIASIFLSILRNSSK
jgi:hypothetical protein